MKFHEVKIYTFFALASLFWFGGIFAAPLLEAMDFSSLAHGLYQFYGKVCHQDSHRSFFCFGEQLAVCIRCTALYGSFTVAWWLLVVFTAFRSTGLHSAQWTKAVEIFLLFAVVLMLADVGSSLALIHQSTTVTRLITGALVGFAVPWYIAPILYDALITLFKRKFLW